MYHIWDVCRSIASLDEPNWNGRHVKKLFLIAKSGVAEFEVVGQLLHKLNCRSHCGSDFIFSSKSDRKNDKMTR